MIDSDQRIVFALRQPGDERSIDLELRDRQPAQMAERRIAGAEVVDDQLDAHRVQLVEALHRPLGVRHHDVLGDFEREARRVHPPARRARRARGRRTSCPASCAATR